MDLSELDPMPKTYIKIGNELFQPVQSIGQPTTPNKPQETVEPENVTPSKASDTLNLPEGFMKTKFEDTLEKINPVAERNQKAGKRFFCSRCMANAIYTGYTKRFDLTKHLERCGKEVTDKPFSCSGYGDCEKSFARIENLRQHVASAHTKETLYKCKKCGRGFSRSSEATGHRKICYSTVTGNDNDDDGNDKDQDKDQDKDKEEEDKDEAPTLIVE